MQLLWWRWIAGSTVQLLATPSRLVQVIHLADKGDAEGIQQLLLHSRPGLSCEKAPGSLETAWHAAARSGSVPVMECLWEAANSAAERHTMDAVNHRGNSPLMLALSRGHTDAAMWLLKKGAAPLRWGLFRSTSTLHKAAIGGSEACMVALLRGLSAHECRAWVNASSRRCNVRPLHYAAALGHASIIRVLLWHGAELNAMCERWAPGRSGLDLHTRLEPLLEGMRATALHLAARNGHRAAVAELLHHYHDNAASLQDPRLITNSHQGYYTLPCQVASQLASSHGYRHVAAMTHPSSDLHNVVCREAAHEDAVPSLRHLAAVALKAGVIAGVEAVWAELQHKHLLQQQNAGHLYEAAFQCATHHRPAAAVQLLRTSCQLEQFPPLCGTGIPGLCCNPNSPQGGCAGSFCCNTSSLSSSYDSALDSYQANALLSLDTLHGGCGADSQLPGISAGNPANGSLHDKMDDQCCAVCLSRAVELRMTGCRHRLCCSCMYELSTQVVRLPLLCPLCRGPVGGVEGLVRASSNPTPGFELA